MGPKHVRSIIEKVSLQNCKDLEKAKSQHRILDLRISNLDVPKHASQTQELKYLKIEKLRLKDKIFYLMKESMKESYRTFELGVGGFGKVVFGRCVNTGKEAAIKIAPIENFSSLRKEYSFLKKLKGMGMLLLSYSCSLPFKYTASYVTCLDLFTLGFPTIHYFGKQSILELGEKVVMVMDVLGPSLDKLLFSTTMGVRGFSSDTVLQLIPQMLSRLETLSRYFPKFCPILILNIAVKTLTNLLNILNNLIRNSIVHGDIQPGNFLMGKEDHDNRTVCLQIWRFSVIMKYFFIAANHFNLMLLRLEHF